jgi:methyltransferase family protein
MGIDVPALQLLRWASSRSRGLGVTATIGRQSVNVSANELRKQVTLPDNYQYSQYCEELLIGALGSTRVDSFDYSDFEGCTYVADMNKPLTHPGQYDTIIDSGTLEHIYNVPQALQNLSALCAAGGQILHMLPANNQCGHGFWQFSPELFFSLYSAKNGYAETQVFIVDADDETAWYEVLPPRSGHRATVFSDTSLSILCRTVRRGAFSHENVQQSDYVFAWNKAPGESIPEELQVRPSRLRETLKRGRFIRLVKSARFLYLSLAVGVGLKRGSLTGRNPSLVKRRVSELS